MKLLLIDKDNTLVSPASGETFVQNPSDQQPIPGMQEVIKRYREDLWTIAIISNQAGIAAGHKSLDDTFLEFKFCLELFPQISDAFFCPDFQGKDCWRVWEDCAPNRRTLYGDGWTSQGIKLAPFRKPDYGMLQLAVDVYAASDVLYVGDRPEDETAADRAGAGIRFMWASDFLSAK